MLYFDSSQKRLIYVDSSADSKFWDRQWLSNKEAIFNVMQTKNTYVSRITKKYINQTDGQILIGGCGRGHHVAALSNIGFKCIGVDYAKETVKTLNQHAPELNIRFGDVRELQYADGTFYGYWSLGLIEHLWDGYQNILDEMSRVVRDDGYLFVTFPYMSPLRLLKSKLKIYPKWCDNQKPQNFYQFALDHKAVIKDFCTHGFNLVSVRGLDGIKGMKSELRIFRNVLQTLYDYRGQSFFLRGFRLVLSNFLASFAAHSVLLVFRRSSR